MIGRLPLSILALSLCTLLACGPDAADADTADDDGSSGSSGEPGDSTTTTTGATSGSTSGNATTTTTTSGASTSATSGASTGDPDTGGSTGAAETCDEAQTIDECAALNCEMTIGREWVPLNNGLFCLGERTLLFCHQPIACQLFDFVCTDAADNELWELEGGCVPPGMLECVPPPIGPVPQPCN